jgi:hypothetical protein
VDKEIIQIFAFTGDPLQSSGVTLGLPGGCVMLGCASIAVLLVIACYS